MDREFLLGRLRIVDERLLPFGLGVAAAIAPISPRASVPILFVLFAWQIVGAARRRTMVPLNIGLLAGCLALVVWAYLSTLWSIAPTAGAASQLLFLLLAGFFVLAGTAQRLDVDIVLRYLGIGFAVAVAIYVFEAISWGWLTRQVRGFEWRDILDDDLGGIAVMSYLINGTVVLALFAWPLMTALRGQRRSLAAGAVFTLAAVLTFYFGNETGLIALGLGIAVWIAAAFAGRRIAHLCAALFVIVVLAVPFVSARVITAQTIDKVVSEIPGVPSSALVRLMVWKFTTDKIMERPVMGWGYDAARRIPGGGERFEIKDAAGRTITSDLNLPLHPHNQILQIWLELGLIGALIVAATGALILIQIGRLPALARNGSLALAVSVLVFDALSYGAWQSWWIGLVFLAAIAQRCINMGLPR